MSADGESHKNGTCDNCHAIGPLGWVVGKADKTHQHACTNVNCRDALEREG